MKTCENCYNNCMPNAQECPQCHTDFKFTITVKEYDKLMESVNFLAALEAAGVDNWEGYSEAHLIMEESNA